MLGAGFGVFGLSYLGSAFYGAQVADGSSDVFDPELGPFAGQDDGRRRAYGYRMMIPVAGPFAAAAVAPSATTALLSSLAGVAQVAGLSMGIAGAVIWGKERKRRKMEQVALSGSVLQGGGVLAVSGRF